MSNVWDAMKKHQSSAQPPAAQESKDQPQVIGEPLEEGVYVSHVSPATVSSATAKAGITKIVEIPHSHKHSLEIGKGYSQALLTHFDRGGKVSEDYRALRTSLLAQSQQEGFAYVVTSAQAGEGKTVTSLNLGIIMTECNDKATLIVDCNMRNNSIAKMVGIKSNPGLADMLRGGHRLDDIIQPSAYKNLSLISSGVAKHDEVAELLGKPAMEQAIAELRKRYDYIFFDTPAVNVFADAGIIGRTIGQALMVVRIDKTPRESVERCAALLRSANINPSGVILTHRKHFIPACLYRCA